MIAPPAGAVWTVVGTAAAVWDDLDRWRPAGPVMIINRMIADYPGAASAGAALHEWSVAAWAPKVPVWSPRGAPGVTDLEPMTPAWHGTSSLYAVEVVLRRYRAGRVVLAGCPLDDGPHYYKRGALAPNLEFYRAGWLVALPELGGRVRSLSGWTAELLGSPRDGGW